MKFSGRSYGDVLISSKMLIEPEKTLYASVNVNSVKMKFSERSYADVLISSKMLAQLENTVSFHKCQ